VTTEGIVGKIIYAHFCRGGEKRLSQRLKGYSMVVFGAVMWGLSGTVAQRLFQPFALSLQLLCSHWSRARHMQPIKPRPHE
jgi:hypothetical protein